MEVKPGQPAENRAELLRLFSAAADQGARLAVGPEMCLSGYCFERREDIAPFVETDDGPTAAALAALAKERQIWLAAAWAERDRRTDMFYNSAFFFGPDGRLAGRYRKVNAESRWACPGPAAQDNVFSTPWGGLGLLVCADSYHSLMPRSAAMKGADLIVIPANWPNSGLDPRSIWRLRALENGCFVLVCNRTGRDGDMDCRSGSSFLAGPGGEVRLDRRSETSCLILTSLPLTKEGRLAGLERRRLLASRRRELYHRCYGHFSGIADLTSFLRLPAPGFLDVHCLTMTEDDDPVALCQRQAPFLRPGGLALLPLHPYADAGLERLRTLALENGLTFLAARQDQGLQYFWLGAETRSFRLPDELGEHDGYPRLDCGPARVMLAPLRHLLHPELALSAAKWGVDLTVSSEEIITPAYRNLIALRPIEQIALAAAGRNGAAIALPPQGHQAGRGAACGPGDHCQYVLDTRETRRKLFQDRIDFETLFQPASEAEGPGNDEAGHERVQL
jgi:predicted amidohydrolase